MRNRCGPGAGGERAAAVARVSFPRLQAWQIVGQRCQQRHYEVDSAQFVREVCDNHLLADQGEQLAFAHEMYQEYFAACRLKWRYEADSRVVEPLQGQTHWREPPVLLWGLLESPQALYQRIVRDEPAVAAECLASAIAPKADETEQLRQGPLPRTAGAPQPEQQPVRGGRHQKRP